VIVAGIWWYFYRQGGGKGVLSIANAMGFGGRMESK